MYHAFGLSPERLIYDPENRPHRISDGMPIKALFGEGWLLWPADPNGRCHGATIGREPVKASNLWPNLPARQEKPEWSETCADVDK